MGFRRTVITFHQKISNRTKKLTFALVSIYQDNFQLTEKLTIHHQVFPHSFLVGCLSAALFLSAFHC